MVCPCLYVNECAHRNLYWMIFRLCKSDCCAFSDPFASVMKARGVSTPVRLASHFWKPLTPDKRGRLATLPTIRATLEEGHTSGTQQPKTVVIVDVVRIVVVPKGGASVVIVVCKRPAAQHTPRYLTGYLTASLRCTVSIPQNHQNFLMRLRRKAKMTLRAIFQAKPDRPQWSETPYREGARTTRKPT